MGILKRQKENTKVHTVVGVQYKIQPPSVGLGRQIRDWNMKT